MTADALFLSTKEVAEILGVHQKTVHHWLRTGRLAGTKISYRAWRIPRTALDEFIAKNSNVHPRKASHEEIAADQERPESPDNHASPQDPGARMKHYIRDIMGEDNSNQTNNK
ncbi:helix-turn-helix domain-containing protein [Methanoregula sp.]|uniref:helix-turn-helix domain-containing protein n=1 Tax=Methanoregula sp. TaxID=2052170 RepID=UPI002CDFDB1A|nr:helix-turn-helix domain-containing protein [Methanoregula sp.]HVP96685.1 helix-turn-helix domain-containing protein [Methanoregula sp.]